MAVDLQRTIEIIFAGVDNVGPTVQSVGRSLDELQGKVGSVTGPMADFTKTILSTEAALVGIGLAMAGIAVNEAGKFEGALQEIGTLFGATDEQVRELADGILEFSQNSGKSIEQINAAVYQAISTGTDYADAIGFVAEAERLAVAGRADLAEVTTVLSAVMNAYGASADEASYYSDILFTTVQKGATSVPQLASSLSAVTSIASAAGVSFEDVSAAIAAITASGTGTSETITQLRALITELLKPTDSLKEALGGVSLEADGLDGVIARLAEATGGSADEMVKLFGSTEAVQAALTLANDSAGNYASSITAMGEAMGVTEREAERMIKQFAEVNQTFANIIQATFIKAGLPILDEYNDVVGALGDLFKGVQFSLDSGAFKPIYDAIEDGSEVITEFIRGVAEALQEALAAVDFEGLIAAFSDLSGAIRGLFGDLDLTKAEDLQEAIQFIINGIEVLTRYSASAVESFGPFVQSIAELVNKATEGDKAFADFAGTLGGIATVIDTLLPSVGGLGNVLATVGGGLAVLGGARQAGLAITSLTTLGAVFTNPVTGLIAVFGAAAYAVIDFSNSISEFNDRAAEMKRVDDLWSQAGSMADSWGDMIVKAKQLGADVSHLADVFEETYGITIEQAEGYDTVSEAMDGVSKKAEELANAEKKVSDERARARMESQIAALDEQDRARRQEEYKQSILDQVEAYRALSVEQYNKLTADEREAYWKALLLADQKGWLNELEKEKGARSEITEEQRKQEAELKKEVELRKEAKEMLLAQTQQLYDFQTALEEIASNERIRGMELKFEFDIEQMRQNAETARAIISSIGETVNSTGETLVGLAELLTGFSSTSSSGYREIMEIIQNEETRRDEAIEMQQEITRAQVEQMDAQTALLRQRADAYARGDAAITINGEGLQPHLEAFMWEILETLQVRVNAEGHAMLLGV
jgi:TP901 family phage tail tape measure protein